ncbi:MAG: hypothetical protein HUU50_20130 [Candidatus Brocadiae bacterium]|nr:hypothetical protein [Candidatus Brocadiia bacterium]
MGKKFFFILMLSICFIGCHRKPPSDIFDISISQFSRSDSSDLKMPIDYKDLGYKALKENNYKVAFIHFHNYMVRNPQEIEGPLYCAEAKYKIGEYAQSIYFYRRALKINSDDTKAKDGIMLCYRMLLDQSLLNSYFCKDEELKEILTSFVKLSNSLQEKTWKEIPLHASLNDLVHSAGFAPQTEQELQENIAAYLGFVTSPPALAYLESLQVANVITSGSLARMDLEGIEGKNKDSIFFKKIGGNWQAVLLFSSLFEGSKS